MASSVGCMFGLKSLGSICGLATWGVGQLFPKYGIKLFPESPPPPPPPPPSSKILLEMSEILQNLSKIPENSQKILFCM